MQRMRIKYWNKGGDVKKYTQPIIIPFILRANKHIFQYPIPIWIESCKDPCPMIHKISLVLNILCKEHTTNQFPRQIGTNSVTGTKLFQPLFRNREYRFTAVRRTTSFHRKTCIYVEGASTAPNSISPPPYSKVALYLLTSTEGDLKF